MMRNKYVMILTYKIFVRRFRTLTKTFRMLQETVSADGMWYSGLPVLIRLWKAWSVTILKGCLLSDTQRTFQPYEWHRKSGVITTFKGVSYLASVEVCWWCKKVTLPFLICSNSAVIVPSRNFNFSKTMHAASKSLVPSADLPFQHSNISHADADHLSTLHHPCPNIDKRPSHSCFDTSQLHIQICEHNSHPHSQCEATS